MVGEHGSRKFILSNNRLTHDVDWSVFMQKIWRQEKVSSHVNLLGILCEKVENIVGKGENAAYQHFLLFPQHFQKVSFSGLWSRDWTEKG